MPHNPKILIITYYWPPAGGISVRRWLALSNEMVGLEAEVHVLTLEENSAEYHSTDQRLLDEVDGRIHLHRISAWNPFRLTKQLFKKHIPPQGFSAQKEGQSAANLLTRLRSNVFIPDPRKTWNRRAVRKAVEIIDAHEIQAIITTSPPHSVQLIGREVMKKRRVRWIADFRDPWTDIFYYHQLGHSALSKFIDSKLERDVLIHANALTTVSWGFKELFHSKVPSRSAEDIHVIPNGIDQAIVAWKPASSAAAFRMVYTGMLTDLYEIEPFLRAIQEHNNASGTRTIQFDLYGSIPTGYQHDLEQEFSFMHFHGNRPMDEIPAIQEAADGLFLVGPKDYNRGHIPGKLFEYLRASRPLFYLGDTASDVGRILDETRSGVVFDRRESNQFQDLIQGLIAHELSEDELRQRNEALAHYLRSSQAAAFLKIIGDFDSE